MAAYVSAKHGMARRAALMASIACIATSAAAQPPAKLVELSLTNAPFVLRDGRTALASVVEVGFAPGNVQPDPAGADQILALIKRVGPTCIRSMQVIGHADEPVSAGSTTNAIQARARADGLAAIMETDGLEPDKIARLWSDHRGSGAPGATIWVFVDGMRSECALASSIAMASSAAEPDAQVAAVIDDGIGKMELMEGQFVLGPEVAQVAETLEPLAPLRGLESATSPDPTPPVAPVPVRKPTPPPRIVSMGVDDGQVQARPVRASDAARSIVLGFADNSSYLTEKAAKTLDRLARDLLAGPSCHLELQGTVAISGTHPEYARWLATRRMARIEEALRSRLPSRPLVFQHKLRERDDSRSVLVTPYISPGCRTASQAGRQVTAQSFGPLPLR